MSDSTTKQIVQLRDWEDYVGETLRLIDSKYKYEYERHMCGVHVKLFCKWKYFRARSITRPATESQDA